MNCVDQKSILDCCRYWFSARTFNFTSNTMLHSFIWIQWLHTASCTQFDTSHKSCSAPRWALITNFLCISIGWKFDFEFLTAIKSSIGKNDLIHRQNRCKCRCWNEFLPMWKYTQTQVIAVPVKCIWRISATESAVCEVWKQPPPSYGTCRLQCARIIWMLQIHIN